VALFGTNKIATVDPRSMRIAEHALPNPAARPRRLALSPDGAVWYSDFARGFLGRLDPASGQVREFASPGGSGSGPYGIAIAPDGRIWYDEAGTSQIVVFDPATERAQTVAIPTKGAIVRNMTVDSTRGRIWLALSGTQRLGRIDVGAGR
jgi:virginiamycin B lyase